MAVLTTSATLKHSVDLPPQTTFSRAVSLLRNHDWLLRLDPELHSYTTSPTIPAPNVKVYNVIDNMEGIPKSIYDAKVHIEIQIADEEDGVEFLVHAPLGVVQRAKWKVVGEEGKWKLVIETVITCSRILMGIVRGKGDVNGPMMGRSFVELLEREAVV